MIASDGALLGMIETGQATFNVAGGRTNPVHHRQLIALSPPLDHEWGPVLGWCKLSGYLTTVG